MEKITSKTNTARHDSASSRGDFSLKKTNLLPSLPSVVIRIARRFPLQRRHVRERDPAALHEDARGVHVVEPAQVSDRHERGPRIPLAVEGLGVPDALRPRPRDGRKRTHLHDHGRDLRGTPPSARGGGVEHLGAHARDQAGEVAEVCEGGVLVPVVLHCVFRENKDNDSRVSSNVTMVTILLACHHSNKSTQFFLPVLTSANWLKSA